LEKEKGFTLTELLFVLGIIVILLAIAVNIFDTYQTAAREAIAQDDLKKAYKAAQAFWTENPIQGTVTVGDLAAYGFRTSPNVRFGLLNGTMGGFLLAVAYDIPGSEIFLVNAQGEMGPACAPLVEYAQIGQKLSTDLDLDRGGIDYKDKKEDSVPKAKTELKKAYGAALSYFAYHPDGVIRKDILGQYGYQPNNNVNLAISDGTLSRLSILASSSDSGGETFVINSRGEIF
jgi:prepilin-type N-terminal cleavage/methylation domain-containing protein